MAQIIATKENDRQRIVLWDNLADGTYAAADVYGEIEQRLDIALPGGRGITVALTRGSYDVRYDAETDTLQIGCDKSDDSEIDCHAEVGGPLVSQANAAKMVGNIYHCRANAEIVEIEQYLNATAPLRIEYFVYAADDRAALSMPLSGLKFTAPFDLLRGR